jgi:hypothetical protein
LSKNQRTVQRIYLELPQSFADSFFWETCRKPRTGSYFQSSSFLDFEHFQKPETGGYRKIKELSNTGKNKIKLD